MRRLSWRIATYALLAGAVLRITLIAALDPHFVDFYCFVDAAQALMRGLDPFKLENLRWVQWGEAPLVYPGLALFFIPFALIGPEIGKHVFYVLNVTAGIAFYVVVIRASGLCTRFSLRNPDAQTAVVTLGAFLFVNSIFFTLCIRVGQISLLASLLLFFSLAARSESSRVASFGLAAVAKYSNIPIAGVLYLLTFRFRLCAFSFLVFAFVSALPIASGQNIVGLYSSYANCLQIWMAPGGGNSFAESGQTMLSLGLFKSTFGAICLSAALLGALVLPVLRERRRRAQGYDLHVVFALLCLTLTIVYHRTYDGVLVYPFILLEAAESYRRRDRANFGIAACFALVFALPGSLLDAVATAAGRLIGENPIMYMPADQLPLTSFLFLLLTCYSVLLCATGGPTCIFGANPGQAVSDGKVDAGVVPAC